MQIAAVVGSVVATRKHGDLQGAKLLHPGDRIQVGYTVLEAQ